MQLIIPAELAARLHAELKRAGRREIGGILMGQNVGPDVFRVLDMTFQRTGGQNACFSRSSAMHDHALKRFFQRTGHNYTEFNYIGEWHSHPSFALQPSETDHATMVTLVRAEFAIPFALLLLTKLGADDRLQQQAYLYTGVGRPREATVKVEGEISPRGDWVADLIRWLGF